MAKTTVTTADQVFDHFLSAHQRQADRSKRVYAYPDYKAMKSEAACQAFNRRMEDAERIGAIELAWEKRGQYLASVRLADTAALYAHLDRVPPSPPELSATALAILGLADPTSAEERSGWIEVAAAIAADWPPAMFAALVAELHRIRAEPPDRPAFITAAAGRLAASKLLDRLPRAALRRIGIPMECYPAPPLVLLTAGAAKPQAVVLVENPRAFERAFAVTRDVPVAWISTHGLLAISIADPLGGRRYGAPVDGNPPPLEILLAGGNLLYWGDLDRAGLMIFAEARKKLPQLRLSALYRPMLDLLADGGGHPYALATDKPRQRLWTDDDPLIQAALLACAERAVDQEWLDDELIRRLCCDAL